MDIISLSRGLSATADNIKKPIEEKQQVFHDIADNTSEIKNDVSEIRTELSELRHEVELLKQENLRHEQELSAERTRSDENEKKAKRQAQWFSFMTVLLSVVLSYAFPRLISWIQSLL